MVSITSPRVSATLAIIIMAVYVFLITQEGSDDLLLPDVMLIFLLTIGTFIAISAFNFAANELKDTDGVISVFDLGTKKFLGVLLFALFIAIGYDALVLILIEIFKGGDWIANPNNARYSEDLVDRSTILVRLIVGFLIVYPFFQYYFLAQPGEDSSIPAEYVTEVIMEGIVELVRSPFIAAVFAYLITYVGPTIFIKFALDVSWFTALTLIGIIFPLISLGALAGAGFGEDLIRLRLIKRKFRDWTKLGWPKVDIRRLDVDVGGLFLVIFAIQAIIMSIVFGILSLINAFGFEQLRELTVLGLFLALFNKGRGATKEMKEVWQESGFKVNIFQLFLPVYVFLGVILSSALEVFITSSGTQGLLDDIQLSDHKPIVASMLVIQNFMLVFTAILIFREPPGTAERRLVKEVPKFYGDDIDGYLFIYGKLKSEESIENLLRVMARRFRDDPSQAKVLMRIIEESLNSESEKVQIAASETLMTITQKLTAFDPDYYRLVQKSLNSEFVGARIYAVRSMKRMINFKEGEDKENAIIQFSEKIQDEDPVVSWDTSLALQSIVKEEPEYRSFILAYMIKNLQNSSSEGTLNAITRFLNRVSAENSETGRMAINLLGIQLMADEEKDIQSIISAIRAIIRGNPFLSSDLLETVSMGIHNPDLELRRQSYIVLSNLAQYGSGQEEEILQLILNGINDDAVEIQVLAYDALAKDVVNHPELVDEIFTILQSKFENLRDEALLAALTVIESIGKNHPDLHLQVFDMIKGASNSSTPMVRASVFKIMAEMVPTTPSLADNVFTIADDNISHETADVRAEAIGAIGESVSSNADLARIAYRKLKTARDDEYFSVQLAAVEAMGHIASASRQLSDEIVENLEPLLRDNDWQVRLAALNGLFAAYQKRRDLVDRLVENTIFAMTDDDRTIRNVALDILIYLVDNYRATSETFIDRIDKLLGSEADEVKATLYNGLQIIAERRPNSAGKVISVLVRDYDNPLDEVRIAINDALRSTTELLGKSRQQSADLNKNINNLISKIQRAANHSSPSIRRNAYEAVTHICVNLPDIRASDRGRTAIQTSIKHEKDVGLADFLEQCRIRAKKPLDLSTL